MTGIDGFAKWYSEHQARLKEDELARFFHQARRLGQHIGVSPRRMVFSQANEAGEREWFYTFQPCPDFPAVPDVDVISACDHYMRCIVEIVFDAYRVFGRQIDPEQYYSEEAFRDRGLTIEDAEEEVIGVRGWTRACDIPIDYRWQILRDAVPKCHIDYLFEKYLGKERSVPRRLAPPPAESLKLPRGWTRREGWILPPGFEDINEYLDALGRGDECPTNNWLAAWHKENHPDQ